MTKITTIIEDKDGNKKTTIVETEDRDTTVDDGSTWDKAGYERALQEYENDPYAGTPGSKARKPNSWDYGAGF